MHHEDHRSVESEYAAVLKDTHMASSLGWQKVFYNSLKEPVIKRLASAGYDIITTFPQNGICFKNTICWEKLRPGRDGIITYSV